MESHTLLVSRNGRSANDPTYCSIAHKNVPGEYTMVRLDGNGETTDRSHTTSRSEVEKEMKSFRGTVLVDDRDDRSLMPLSVPDNAKPYDLSAIQRIKSDECIEAVERMARLTRQKLYAATEVDAKSFRGDSAASKPFPRSAFLKTETAGFVQYRGGFQDDMGHCTDLTRVDAKTPEWDERLDRVYKGLDAIKSHCCEGVKEETIQRIFRAHLDPQQDEFVSGPIYSTGYKGIEDNVKLSKLQSYDLLTLGAVIGNYRGETSTVLREVKEVKEYEPPHVNFPNAREQALPPRQSVLPSPPRSMPSTASAFRASRVQPREEEAVRHTPDADSVLKDLQEAMMF